MAKRIAPVGVVSFVLLAACGAVCQVHPSLPDAPSARVLTPAERFNGFSEEAGSPLKSGAMGASAGVMRPAELVFSDRAAFPQKDPNAIFRKYLYPSSLKQQSVDHSTSSASLMGRATYAAARTVVRKDESGKGKLNTSYLLRTLTSVAKDAASTPYWRRHLTAPFSDFGSTVGNDAGMNLWHEFRPGIEQLAKTHTPAFVSRIEERISHR
jgi:hypothetical protein